MSTRRGPLSRAAWGAIVAVAMTVGGAFACSASTSQKEAAGVVATRIADDVCHEIGGTDVWVDLACAAEGAIASEVRVRMPRAEWRAVRARRLDSGPGL